MNGLIHKALKETAARRIPKMSIQSGVVICPNKLIPEANASTIVKPTILSPKMNAGIASNNPKVVGFINADFMLIYFVSFVVAIPQR